MELEPPPPPLNPNPNLPNPTISLEFNFQNLNLSQTEEIQVDLEEQNQEAISSPYNLLFKVGSPDGKAKRNFSLLIFEKAMRAAWGRRFCSASPVDSNVFMAHFREEDDLRWVCQRQPWILERETMLVEVVDPQGDRPIDSYTFRYLPVTVHLYGIPKHLRSMGLVNKIIEKIGVKDASVAFSEDIMFKPHDFVLARVILDVRKPLLDSIIISLSQSKKFKVYIFYEKIARICSFCGCLFHTVASCSQRLQIIWKLNPSEAAKVPQENYGKWRIQETEIPREAREDQNFVPKNALIQAFRDHFQKQFAQSSSTSSLSGQKAHPESSMAAAFNWHSMRSENMQLVAVNANTQCNSQNIGLVPEGAGQKYQGAGRDVEMENERPELSVGNNQMVLSMQGALGPINQNAHQHSQTSSTFGFQAHQHQSQTTQWQYPSVFTQGPQWQQQANPFAIQGITHLNRQNNLSINNTEGQKLGTQPKTLPSLPPPDPSMAEALNLSHGALQPPQGNKTSKKSRSSNFLTYKASQSNSSPAFKRQASPISQPPCKKSLSPPFFHQPRSPLSLSTENDQSQMHPSPENQLEHVPHVRRRHGSQSSRWDRDAVGRPDGNGIQVETAKIACSTISEHVSCGGTDASGGEKPPPISEGDIEALVAANSTNQAIDGASAPALKAPQAP